MNLLLLAALLATPGPVADFQVHRVWAAPVAVVQEEPPTAPRTKAEIEKDLAEARSANETESIIAYLFELVDLYLAEEDYEEALKQAEEAEKLAAGIEDDSLKYTVQYYLAEAHYGLENAESAIKHFREAMRLAVRIDFKDGEFYTAYRLTLLLEEEELLEEAIKVGRQALSLAVELGEKESQAALHDVMGNIYSSQKKWELAIKEYQEGLVLYRELKNDEERASSLEVLAECFVELEDYSKAEAHYAEAIPLLRSTRQYGTLPDTLEAYSEVLHKVGKSKEARATLFETIAFQHVHFSAARRIKGLLQYGDQSPSAPFQIFLAKYSAITLHELLRRSEQAQGRQNSQSVANEILTLMVGPDIEEKIREVMVKAKADKLLKGLENLGKEEGLGPSFEYSAKEKGFAEALEKLYSDSAKMRTQAFTLMTSEDKEAGTRLAQLFEKDILEFSKRVEEVLLSIEEGLQ